MFVRQVSETCRSMFSLPRTRESTLSLFEIALVLLRLDYVASFIVNANHGIFGAAAKRGVIDSVGDCIRLAVRQANAHSDRIKAAFTQTRRICHGIVV